MINEHLYDADFVARATPGFDQLAEAVQEYHAGMGAKARLTCLLMLCSGHPRKWPPVRLMLSSATAIARRFRRRLICGV